MIDLNKLVIQILSYIKEDKQKYQKNIQEYNESISKVPLLTKEEENIINNLISSDLTKENINKYCNKNFNIYNLFFKLCEIIEKAYLDSCSACPLNDFCFVSKENNMEKFWEMIYTNML